jgi:hypothetical protein
MKISLRKKNPLLTIGQNLSIVKGYVFFFWILEINLLPIN